MVYCIDLNRHHCWYGESENGEEDWVNKDPDCLSKTRDGRMVCVFVSLRMGEEHVYLRKPSLSSSSILLNGCRPTAHVWFAWFLWTWIGLTGKWRNKRNRSTASFRRLHDHASISLCASSRVTRIRSRGKEASRTREMLALGVLCERGLIF